MPQEPGEEGEEEAEEVGVSPSDAAYGHAGDDGAVLGGVRLGREASEGDGSTYVSEGAETTPFEDVPDAALGGMQGTYAEAFNTAPPSLPPPPRSILRSSTAAAAGPTSTARGSGVAPQSAAERARAHSRQLLPAPPPPPMPPPPMPPPPMPPPHHAPHHANAQHGASDEAHEADSEVSWFANHKAQAQATTNRFGHGFGHAAPPRAPSRAPSLQPPLVGRFAYLNNQPPPRGLPARKAPQPPLNTCGGGRWGGQWQT